MSDQAGRMPAQRIFSARLLIGLAQGLLLYFLYSAYEDRSWPATSGYLFAPLLVFSLFVPLLALQGIGNLRAWTLTVWTGTASVILVALALYDIWHAWPMEWVYQNAGAAASGVSQASEIPVLATTPDPQAGSWLPTILPSLALLLALPPALFVAHALVSAGDNDRRAIADYPTYFDIAWKLAVQLGLSLAFVGVFWIFLRLGAILFNLIDLDFFEEFIEKRWFAIPATALALSAAVHITDVRANLIRGTRTLVHTLLSWLLPLLVLILAGFLIALIFTGLDPLWSTRSATAFLTVSAAASILLVNAAYQDGGPERELPFLLRHSGSLGALLPVPLVALAAYALGLRINQYGWTADRVLATAVVVVASFYAAGYAAAIFRRGGWLKAIERWNVYGAVFALATFLLLFGPVVDPMRIGVGDQMARLESGVTPREEFDFTALRWDGGRFGKARLDEIATAGPTDEFRDAAKNAIEMKSRWERSDFMQRWSFTENVNIHPSGKALPGSFLEQYSAGGIGGHLMYCSKASKCDLYVGDLNGDGTDEVMYVTPTGLLGYREGADGRWESFGNWRTSDGCGIEIGEDGNIEVKPVPTLPFPWPDVEMGGKRLHFTPQTRYSDCSVTDDP